MLQCYMSEKLQGLMGSLSLNSCKETKESYELVTFAENKTEGNERWRRTMDLKR